MSAAAYIDAPQGTAETLLARLSNVRQHGSGWRATCPAHGSGKNSALSVTAAGDGRVLIHCFAGCTPLEVMHAVGLGLADLFPRRITHATTPADRRRLRELARQSQWRAALPALCTEALVVLMAAGKIDRGEPLDRADDDRLLLAIERIESARMVLHDR